MESYSYYLDKIGEFGTVTEVKHHIAVVNGLPYAKPREVVVLESEVKGQIFSINRETSEILLFSKEGVRVGSKVARTGEVMEVAVGDELLGRIISPFGRPLVGVLGYTEPQERRKIEIEPSDISSRVRIQRPLLTGVSIVDLAVPLGCGQRELVIGDRKTGKSFFLLNAIKSQVRLGAVAIYCAIARKKSDIKVIGDYLENEGLMANSIIVASSYDDPPSLVFIAPFTAMSIAEYFRDKGRDVVLILDDMTTHAKYYRELSLLSRRFPGRDSYPGDMFYIQAKLLERAGNFTHPEKKEVSITCLPVAETIGEDLDYISTNLMSMTDGHIFFDSGLYYKGRRPAINVSTSVSRVGRQTQGQLQKDINARVSVLLAEYEKLQNLSHFGAELTETVRQTIDVGDKIYSFFEQDYSDLVPQEVQVVLMGLIFNNYFYGKKSEVVKFARKNLIESLTEENARKLVAELAALKSFENLLAQIESKQKEVLKLCKIND